MPANLLILPLLAGYLFTHFVHLWRFRAQSLDGNRLLFESAAAGIALGAFARVAVSLILKAPGGVALRDFWISLFPFDYSGTAAVSLVLGAGLPWLVNLCVDQDAARRRAFRRHADNLLQFLMTAFDDRKLVLISLSTRKFYIGWVLKLPNLNPQQAFIGVLPVLSGYRDDKTLELRFTADYANVYEGDDIDPANFIVTLPVAEIRSASFFDPSIYPRFTIEDGPSISMPNKDESAKGPVTSA